MALSFSVFNKFKAIDGVTAPIRKMTKNVGKFGKKTVTAFRNADRKASRFHKTLKTLFVGGAIIAGIALLTQGIRSATSQFIEFDDSIIAAGARFKDIGPDVDNFTERIQGIKKAARDAGATTEFTAAQSASALDFLAKAGFKSTEAIGSLVSMINLATATGEDFAAVADMSSDLLGAFGLASDNTTQKIANLNRLNDVLVKTTNTANVTVTDMFETMKQVGPIATGVLGASLEEVSSLTAVLGSSGIKGSEAMTALKNAYLRLAAPTSTARKMLKAMQVSIDDGKGGARKMTDVMSDLGKKISGLGKIKQAEILDELFGKRAIAGGKNLIDNIKNIKKFEKTLLKAGGASKKTAELMRTSLGNRLKTLNSSLTELGFKILENFEVKGKNALDSFTAAIRNIDVAPIVESLKSVINVSIKLFKALKEIARFINEVFIQSFRDVIDMNEEFVPAIKILIGLIVGLKIATLALSVATGVLNAVLAINPFVLAATAIIAVVLAVRQVIKHWDGLKAAFIDGLKWISAVHDKMGMFALLTPFTAILLGIKLVVKHWDALKSMFVSGFAFISDIVLVATDFWFNLFAGLGENISAIFSTIGDFIENILSGIGDKINNIIGTVVKIKKATSDMFTGVGDKFQDFSSGVGSKVKNFFGFGAKEQAAKQNTVPISPNAGLTQTLRQETENRSRVSIDFSNLPKGAKVKKSGSVPGFDLDLGFAGAQ